MVSNQCLGKAKRVSAIGRDPYAYRTWVEGEGATAMTQGRVAAFLREAAEREVKRREALAKRKRRLVELGLKRGK
jgi:hypothetical protein